jgi:acyl-CoA thioester hydrolase
VNANIQAAKAVTLDQLSALPITKEATIDEEYLDSNRHMNVSFYFRLFNQATGGLHKLLGFDWREQNSEGAGSFILEGHTRYLAEVLVGQHVTIRTRLIGWSAKRLQLLHFMSNDDAQSIASTDERVLAHIDLTTRRMAPYPAGIAGKIEEMLVDHRKLTWDPPVCGIMQA